VGAGANHRAYSRDRRLAAPLQPLDGGSNIGETSRALRCTPCCPRRPRERLAGAQAGQGSELALHLHISNTDFLCLSHDPNNSHRHCSRGSQTSGQCGDCRCVKSAGLNRYPVFLHSTHHPDVANVYLTGRSSANVARRDCASRSDCGNQPANKDAANASRVRANSRQKPEPLPSALMFHWNRTKKIFHLH
jgi:hypothetical protein